MKRLSFVAGALAIILSFMAFKLFVPQKINIIFIGDSITYGQNSNDLQPGLYAKNYLQTKFKDVAFDQRNRGVSGYTTLNFLPGQPDFDKVVKDADSFYADETAQLIFSVMLGTNDSAIQGPPSAPVQPQQYAKNLKIIADTLLKRYPNSKIILNYPIWYSPNTYNGAMYLQEGLDRLQSYLPEIAALVKSYDTEKPGHVFIGYANGFDDFRKNYLHALQPEQGRQGTFYLHPNKLGASYLGMQWGKAIEKLLK